MSEVSIADRIKNAIIESGGYQRISELTGISKSTLARTASGQTEPKLKDAIAIARATGVTLNYLAYGMLTEDEEASADSELRILHLMQEFTTTAAHEIRTELDDLKRELNEVKAQKENKKNTIEQTIVEARNYRSKLISAIENDLDIPEPENESELAELEKLTKDMMPRREAQLKKQLKPTQE